MNRTGLRVFAVGVSLLFWGAPQATAQTAPPAPPLTPKARVRGAASLAVSADKIVSDAVSTAAPSEGKTAGITNRLLVLNSRVLNGLPEKRQDIDLADVPLRDALKRVLDDSKTPYVLDDDIPNEPKVSIKLVNAPLTTILDALTLSNHIGWRTEFKRSKTITETTETKSGGKPGRVGDASSFLSVARGGSFVTQIHVGKTVTALPNSFQFRTLDIEGPPTAASQNMIRGEVAPQAPQVRIFRWQSQKRTFTCPRCHNTISILQQPEEVRCTKCRRTFEDDWKVCPFDGTKRPEPKNKWRFCPICGKSITLETSWSPSAQFMYQYHQDLPAAFEIGPLRQEAARYFPSLPGLAEDDAPKHDAISAESGMDQIAPLGAITPDLHWTQ